MPVAQKKREKSIREALFADMDELRVIVARQFEVLGIAYNPMATADDSRKAILSAGFRPEDNEFSRGIIASREE